MIAAIAALGLTHDAHAGKLKQRTAAPRAKLAAEQARYGRMKIVPRARLVSHPGKTKRTFPGVVRETGDSVFVRIPRYGVDNALRRHNFVRVAAEQLGRPELIPPAARVTLAENIGDGSIQLGDKVRDVRAGGDVMIVQDVGEDFVPYKKLIEENRDAQVAGAFPDDLRVTGAVLHLLSWQLDGNTTNVLVRDPAGGRPIGPGDVRLIDHDVTLGTKHTGPRINGSVFFPGKPLAYSSRQARFEELPAAARELVAELADSPAAEIAEAYGLEPSEASIVSKAAREIRARGLSGAIQAFDAESPKYHDRDYHRRKGNK